VYPIILTILYIVVGFDFKFRSSTAYERYMEDRKMWSYFTSMSQNLGHVIWIHAQEREGEPGKEKPLWGKWHTFNTMQSLNEVFANNDRVLNTPLPAAHPIAISQITCRYILTLPFQLIKLMG
jgi:predicted membrane chloride channel (bestrophin family)